MDNDSKTTRRISSNVDRQEETMKKQQRKEPPVEKNFDVLSDSSLAPNVDAASQWGDLPKLSISGRVVGAAIDSHRFVVVSGHFRYENTTLLYDNRTPLAGWKSLPKKPGTEANVAACVGDGKLVVLGKTSRNNEEATIYMLDVDKGEWTQLPSMRRSRDNCAVAFDGGYFYIFGGLRYHYTPGMGLGYGLTRYPEQTAERLHLGTMQWEDLPPMPTKRALCVAAPTMDNKIIVAGGTKHDWGTGFNVVEQFDTKNLQWNVDVPPMPQNAFGSAVVSSGRWFVVNGGVERFRDNRSLGITQVYDSVSKIWKVLPAKMSTARGWHAAGLLGGGQLVVAGGTKISGANRKCCSPKHFDTAEGMLLPMSWQMKGPIIMMRWLVQQGRAARIDNGHQISTDKGDEAIGLIVDIPHVVFMGICAFI